MTTLIMGRTGSGKDTLRKLLQKEHGWKFVRSYTTRPQRSAEDAESHVFLTPQEAAKIQDKVAPTMIGPYEYFITKDQLSSADAFIIEPEGIEQLLSNDPDGYYQIVYMRPGNQDMQRELSIQRADDPEKEAGVFRDRSDAEASRFDVVEKFLDEDKPIFPGLTNYEVIPFENTYLEKDLRQLADDLEGHRRFRRNASIAIHDLMAAGVMNHTDGMVPVMFMPDGTTMPISEDMLCGYFREKPEILGDMMYRWLAMPGTDLAGKDEDA